MSETQTETQAEVQELDRSIQSQISELRRLTDFMIAGNNETNVLQEGLALKIEALSRLIHTLERRRHNLAMESSDDWEARLAAIHTLFDQSPRTTMEYEAFGTKLTISGQESDSRFEELVSRLDKLSSEHLEMTKSQVDSDIKLQHRIQDQREEEGPSPQEIRVARLVREAMSRNTDKAFSISGVVDLAGLPRSSADAVHIALYRLRQEGTIIETHHGLYMWKS